MKCKLQKRSLLVLGAAACLVLASPRATAAPAADIDQIRNGSFDGPIDPPNWVNGNAGFENAHYLEGHSIAYRVKMTDLTSGSTIKLRIGFDIRNSGKNSLDYVTHFQNLDPHTQFGTCTPPCPPHPHSETVDPTIDTGFSGQLSNPTSTTAIDLPGTEPGASKTVNAVLEPQTSFNNLTAQKAMSLWGGTLTDFRYVNEGDVSLDQSETIFEVTFTANGPSALLAWGGHIASRKDWGFVTVNNKTVPDSAGGISGSPYHMRLKDWTIDGQVISLGNQDRSLKANAVIIPPTCTANDDAKCVGEAAQLCVTPHTEIGGFGGNYTFAWRKVVNGVCDSTQPPISTLQCLVFNPVKLSDNGTYCVIVKDSKGIASEPCTGTLNVNSPPTVSVNSTSTCDGTAVEVKATITLPNGATAKCKWTCPDGSDPGDVTSFNTKVAGKYTVVVTDSNTCSNSGEGTVTVNALPKVAVNSPATCEGAPVDVKATAIATSPATITNYAWTVPTGVTNPGNTNSFKTTVAGDYSVLVTDSHVCTAANKGTVTVYKLPTVSVNSPATCEGTPVDVTATASATSPATYVWTVPTGVANPGNTNSFKTTVAGDYSVLVTDSHVCTAANKGTVTVNALPKVAVNSPLTCDGTAVEVTATITLQTGATAKCKWTCPDGSDPGDVTSFKTKVAGKYTVDVTDSNGCKQSGYGIVDVISPAIACGDGEKACGAPVLILHPLDADAFGGAAIVDDAAVPLDTFPSGTDISYESFDQFAVLSLGPNQTTTGASQIPVCNTGDVDLVGVTVTFYKGTASEQTLPNATPTDYIVVETGLPFDGQLAAHQKLTLKCTVRVQCGTVPIIVSGQTSEKEGACRAESSCSTDVPCVEVFCRTTGGGRQDPGATTLLQVKSGNGLVTDTSVKFTTHGGQLRGRQTCSVLGSPDICGQWQHVRHASNGRLQSFHTAGIFDSLRCACLACNGTEVLPDGTVCNPGDRVCGPEPRRANANAIAVTGVGKMALRPGNKDTDVVFRIYIEDRGEPGGSPFGHPEDPPDVYCIQIWIVNPSTSVGLGLRASISCLLGKDLPTGIPVPDISDCGDLSRGNHQLHPVKNLNCP